jgi:hypothetical protein
MIYYVLLSSIVSLGSSLNNYNAFQPVSNPILCALETYIIINNNFISQMSEWPRRGAGHMGNQPDPPQPIADSYLPEGYSEYSDYERSSIPRLEEQSSGQAGWRSQSPQLPNNLKVPVKSKLTIIAPFKNFTTSCCSHMLHIYQFKLGSVE